MPNSKFHPSAGGPNFNQKGQVLLLSVMVLSSIIVSVSFFVGFLMVQRLKQSVLAADSAQAFYLSDSGVELELYRFTKGDNRGCTALADNKNKVLTNIVINGDPTVDPALGWEIQSTGCVGEACRVSRSQMDTSQTLPKTRCEKDPQLWICNDPQPACPQ